MIMPMIQWDRFECCPKSRGKEKSKWDAEFSGDHAFKREKEMTGIHHE